MLQFATDATSLIPQKQQVNIALEGGCEWIRLTSEADIEELAKICEQQQVMLVLDNDVETVDRLRIHGLHMTSWTRGEIIAMREKLGPHAVLGITFPIDGNVDDLKALDIDYITIPKPDAEDYLVKYQKLVTELHAKTKDIHPVASGNFSLEILQSLLATGIEGIEMSQEILTAPMPAEFTKSVIAKLQSLRS